MKVSIQKCKKYSYEFVKKSIEQNFDDLGGIEKYIDAGERVLLKVNMLAKKAPQTATTTHPIFVQALAEILVNYGAKVVIGDSPGGPFNEMLLKSAYKGCGYDEAAEKSGATLNYNTKSSVVKNMTAYKLKSLTITDMLNDVDKVISVSKLKTHSMATFTGAVKNMFGCVPGILKAEYHLTNPEIDDFADCLIDICLCANPILSFMDAIVGMEGAGPSGGEPRKIGLTLASESPYHLDVCACKVINLKPSHVPTIKRCIEREIINRDFSDIETIGADIEKLIIKDYKIPQTQGTTALSMLKDVKLPRPVNKFINKHLKPRPEFIHENCTGCKICAKNCPPKVIRMKNKRPYVKLDGCIRCFCCQELCPKKAVEVYNPLLNKIIFRR